MRGAKFATRKTKCERIASKDVLYIEEIIIIKKYKLHKQNMKLQKEALQNSKIDPV